MEAQKRLQMEVQVAKLEKEQGLLAKEKERLVAIIRGSDAGTWEWNVQTDETDYSERLPEILGYTLEEFSNLSKKTKDNLLHYDDQGTRTKLLQNHFEGRIDHYKLECRMRHKDGHWVWVRVRGKLDSRADGGEPLLMAGTHHDVTEEVQERLDATHQQRFQQLLIEISTDFITAGSKNIDEKIGRMLRKLGEFFGVDRSHLFLFSSGDGKLANTHEWCAEGIEPQQEFLQEIPTDSVTWWTEKIRNGRVVHIPNTARLPDEASSTADILMHQDIKSLLNVPITTSKGVVGAFGFDMVRETKRWSEREIGYLKVLANVLAEAEHKLEAERNRELLQREIEKNYRFEDIVSKNRAMHRIFHSLPRIAESSSSVLIEGESGTGKELLARAIHNRSPRADRPFVKINCGALPETLLESELFGYKAGAFTDAKEDKPGRFESAGDGTVFLDEIGEMDQALQVKLLQVLQDGTYVPVGATSERTCRARIIAATNKNLRRLVQKGRFREDLYYRINVVRLVPPPLRERREDIPLLVKHIIRKLNNLKNRDVQGVSGKVMAVLMGRDFPGNVRELENILEHCFIMCEAKFIDTQHLPPELQAPDSEGDEQPVAGDNPGLKTLKQMERLMIEDALKRNGGNKTAAARQLGIGKRTLYRRLKEYGIHGS